MSAMISNLADAFATCDLDCSVWHRGALTELAKIAIKNMKDPPDEVLLAPGIPYYGLPIEEGIAYRRKAWNTMIDKVLE